MKPKGIDVPIDETKLEKEYTTHFDNVFSHLSKSFSSRRINTHKAYTQKDVTKIIDDIVHDCANQIKKIGFSDSVTLHQLNVYDYIESLDVDCKIINPFKRFPDGKLKVFGKQPEGKLDLPYDEYYKLVSKYVDEMRETLMADLLIIGANAITMQGEIISVDGSGNRISGMIFGPKKGYYRCWKEQNREERGCSFRAYL